MKPMSQIIQTSKDIVYRRWKLLIALSIAIFVIFILTASLVEKKQTEASKKAALKELNVTKVYMKTLENIEVVPLQIQKQKK